MLDIIRYFFVQCLYSVNDIRFGELVSEVVPCANFVSNVSVESGTVMFYSPGCDMLFTVMYDDRGEVFGGCVYTAPAVFDSATYRYEVDTLSPRPSLVCRSSLGS